MENILLQLGISSIDQFDQKSIEGKLADSQQIQLLINISQAFNTNRDDLAQLNFLYNLVTVIQEDELICLVIKLQIFRISKQSDDILCFSDEIQKYRVKFMGNDLFNPLYLCFAIYYIYACYKKKLFAQFYTLTKNIIDYINRQPQFQMQDWEELTAIILQSLSQFEENTPDICNLLYEIIQQSKLSLETRQKLAAIICYNIIYSDRFVNIIYCNFSKMLQNCLPEQQIYLKTLYQLQKSDESVQLQPFSRSEEALFLAVKYKCKQLFLINDVDYQMILHSITQETAEFVRQYFDYDLQIIAIVTQNLLYDFINALYQYTEPDVLIKALQVGINRFSTKHKTTTSKFRCVSRNQEVDTMRHVMNIFIYQLMDKGELDFSYIDMMEFDLIDLELVSLALKTAIRFDQQILFDTYKTLFCQLSLQQQFGVLYISAQQDCYFDDLVLQISSFNNLTPAATQYLVDILKTNFDISFAVKYLKTSAPNLVLVLVIVEQLYKSDKPVQALFQQIADIIEQLNDNQLDNQTSQLSCIQQKFIVYNLINQVQGTKSKKISFKVDQKSINPTSELGLQVTNGNQEFSKYLVLLQNIFNKTVITKKQDIKMYTKLFKMQEQFEYLVNDIIIYLLPRDGANRDFYIDFCHQFKITSFLDE